MCQWGVEKFLGLRQPRRFINVAGETEGEIRAVRHFWQLSDEMWHKDLATVQTTFHNKFQKFSPPTCSTDSSSNYSVSDHPITFIWSIRPSPFTAEVIVFLCVPVTRNCCIICLILPLWASTSHIVCFSAIHSLTSTICCHFPYLSVFVFISVLSQWLSLLFLFPVFISDALILPLMFCSHPPVFTKHKELWLTGNPVGKSRQAWFEWVM